jgi:hypothetical protein
MSTRVEGVPYPKFNRANGSKKSSAAVDHYYGSVLLVFKRIDFSFPITFNCRLVSWLPGE